MYKYFSKGLMANLVRECGPHSEHMKGTLCRGIEPLRGGGGTWNLSFAKYMLYSQN